MAASTAHCIAETKRLAALPVPFGVERKAIMGALASTLQRHARSDNHAAAIIARILDRMTVMPTPAELIDLATQVNDSHAPAGCGRCDENGWVQSVRLIKGQQYDFSGRCSCPRGRYLLQKELENAQ